MRRGRAAALEGGSSSGDRPQRRAEASAARRGTRRRGGRRWLALALLVWSIAAGGCSSGPRPLTLVLAVLPGELASYREVVSAFEREEGRRVLVVAQQYADIRRALAAEAAAGGGGIDLAELDVYSLAAAARTVRRLDPAGPLAPTIAALEPETVRAGTIDGLRFLPHRISWQALVYDREALGRPPETWEDLVRVARRFPGRIGLKGASYEGCTCDVLPFVWAAGGSGERFDDAGARAAFRLFAEIAPYLAPESATFKESTIAEAMARGEIVLHLNWPFAMKLYRSQGLAPERIRSAALPRGPKGRATVLGGGFLGIPLHAPDPAGAERLLAFLLSRDVQRRLAARLGWFSARRDVSPPAEGGLLAGFEAMKAEVRPRPERADYPLLSRLWQRAFRAVVFGRVPPERALAEAQAAFEQARASREGARP